MSNSLGVFRDQPGPSRSYSAGNFFTALKAAANLFGWQKKEGLADPTVLTEGDGARQYRDLNELDSSLTRIRSIRLEESISNHMMNLMHGLPFVALATSVVIDYTTHWSSLRNDVEQIAWNESASAGIPDGSTWYSYEESSSAARYKYTLDILYEVLNHPELGQQRLAHMLRMFKETAVHTIMINTARALAYRPYRNFLLQHTRTDSVNVPTMFDLYQRNTEFLFLGRKHPDFLPDAISLKMAEQQGTLLDTVVVPDISLHCIHKSRIGNDTYNSVIHDATGGQTAGFDNGMRQLVFNEQSTFKMNNVTALLLSMPTFRRRREDPILSGEQTLAKNLTMAMASILRRPIPSIGKDSRVVDRQMMVSMPHITPNDCTWRAFSLAYLVKHTSCGFFFDPDTGGYSEKAKTILKNFNAGMGSKLEAHYDALSSLDSFDRPTRNMIKQVKNNGYQPQFVLGWRDTPLFWCWDEKEHQYFLARSYGQMEEIMLSTDKLANAMALIIEENKANFGGGAPAIEDVLKKAAGIKAGVGFASSASAAMDTPVASAPAFEQPALNKFLGSGVENRIYTSYTARGAAIDSMIKRSGPIGARLMDGIRHKVLERQEKNIGHGVFLASKYLEKMEPHLKDANPEALTQEKQSEILNYNPSAEEYNRHAEPAVAGDTVRAQVQFERSNVHAERMRGAVLDAPGYSRQEINDGKRTGPSKDGTDLAIRSMSREKNWLADNGSYSAAVIKGLTQLFETPITLTTLVGFIRLGLPMMGGRVERLSMRMVVASTLLLKRGESCCKNHVTPLLAHWGMKPIEGRVTVTGEMGEGYEYGDPSSIVEMPSTMPIAYRGGMRAGVIHTLEDFEAYIEDQTRWTQDQSAHTDDGIFLPRSEQESLDEWPQFAFSRIVDRTVGIDFGGESVFLRLSSCHTWLQALMGPRRCHTASSQVLNYLKGLKGEFAPNMCCFVERAPAYGLAEGSGMWDEHYEGTGPLGELRFFDKGLINVLKSGVGQFSEKADLRGAMDGIDL